MYSRVYVEITNICNRNCSFCPGTKREPNRMHTEQFGHILQKLQGVTRYLYFHVMGEPLTHPQLPELIAMAKSAGYHPAITTNGTLLHKCGADLIKAGVYKVHISVHSFEDGTEEEYHRYIAQCMEFADIASQNGILVVLRLWNKGHDNGRNIDIEQILHQRFSGEWQYGNRGITIQKNLFLEYGDRFQWPDMEAQDAGSDVFCYGLKDHFGILCDGTVIPCCLDREGTLALGNIFEQDIQTILQSDRALNMVQGFRNRKASEELCRKCGYARRFSV
ncbi:MAG: radical SAM protein [Peptococcaceae bacterium]|nr:radical SAM protein [Peptococcaceae bacterium]